MKHFHVAGGILTTMRKPFITSMKRLKYDKLYFGKDFKFYENIRSII